MRCGQHENLWDVVHQKCQHDFVCYWIASKYLAKLKDPSVTERAVWNLDHAHVLDWGIVAIDGFPFVTVGLEIRFFGLKFVICKNLKEVVQCFSHFFVLNVNKKDSFWRFRHFKNCLSVDTFFYSIHFYHNQIFGTIL